MHVVCPTYIGNKNMSFHTHLNFFPLLQPKETTMKNKVGGKGVETDSHTCTDCKLNAKNSALHNPQNSKTQHWSDLMLSPTSSKTRLWRAARSALWRNSDTILTQFWRNSDATLTGDGDACVFTKKIRKSNDRNPESQTIQMHQMHAMECVTTRSTDSL